MLKNITIIILAFIIIFCAGLMTGLEDNEQEINAIEQSELRLDI